MLPTVDFFGTPVTRMIVGDNPVNGHSYIPDIYPGEEMERYYTIETTVALYHHAAELGFNTILPLACPKTLEALRVYKKTGGTLNIIFQPYPAVPLEENLKEMMAFDPIGIYHQGTTTDYLMETGQEKTLRANIELIRKTGVPVGCCSHVPETLLKAEEEGWGIDFYMACLYNARHNRRGEQSGFITGKTKSDLKFYPEDRFIMFQAIQNIQKPVIAYKILAGGQILIGKKPEEREAIVAAYIREAYENIKDGDIACVGVFQRDRDQLKENAAVVSAVLGG
jgi:hypothetical protein